jgi:hypothetical protein
MKIRDRSDSNVGGILTDHRAVTPPTPNPNAENGEKNESEHQNVGVAKTHSVTTAPGLMRAHQAGSITAEDSSKLHKPVAVDPELAKPGDGPQGEDGMSEMTKIQKPVTAHIEQAMFGNSSVRTTVGRGVTAIVGAGGKGQPARGPAVFNPD